MVDFNRDNELDNPSPDVLAWCENIVRVIAHGGVWGIPRSGTVFKIDKVKKQLVLTMPGNDDDADFEATKKVFKHIGWEVVKNHGRKSTE